YELSINWSVVTSGYRPSAGAEVGMTMLALDGDMAYSNTRQIMWHGNGDTQANWGILKFSN
ncbi:MAG: hypothetical protein IIY04_01230, partial [Oscillospiraceae bacterium]|nr:hypothetical protein [Oscillospiraceae bacterium]